MYGLILMVHLLAACAFIGTVFFEVMVLTGVKKKLPIAVSTQFEKALSQRLFAIMPWILLTLVLSGLGCYRQCKNDPLTAI